MSSSYRYADASRRTRSPAYQTVRRGDDGADSSSRRGGRESRRSRSPYDSRSDRRERREPPVAARQGDRSRERRSGEYTSGRARSPRRLPDSVHYGVRRDDRGRGRGRAPSPANDVYRYDRYVPSRADHGRYRSGYDSYVPSRAGGDRYRNESRDRSYRRRSPSTGRDVERARQRERSPVRQRGSQKVSGPGRNGLPDAGPKPNRPAGIERSEIMQGYDATTEKGRAWREWKIRRGEVNAVSKGPAPQANKFAAAKASPTPKAAGVTAVQLQPVTTEQAPAAPLAASPAVKETEANVDIVQMDDGDSPMQEDVAVSNPDDNLFGSGDDEATVPTDAAASAQEKTAPITNVDAKSSTSPTVQQPGVAATEVVVQKTVPVAGSSQKDAIDLDNAPVDPDLAKQRQNKYNMDFADWNMRQISFEAGYVPNTQQREDDLLLPITKPLSRIIAAYLAQNKRDNELRKQGDPSYPGNTVFPMNHSTGYSLGGLSLRTWNKWYPPSGQYNSHDYWLDDMTISDFILLDSENFAPGIVYFSPIELLRWIPDEKMEIRQKQLNDTLAVIDREGWNEQEQYAKCIPDVPATSKAMAGAVMSNSHWSSFKIDFVNKVIILANSLGDVRRSGKSEQAVQIMLALASKKPDFPFKDAHTWPSREVPCTSQPNDYECGFATIDNVRHFMREEPIVVVTARNEVRQHFVGLRTSLMEEGGRQQPALQHIFAPSEQSSSGGKSASQGASSTKKPVDQSASLTQKPVGKSASLTKKPVDKSAPLTKKDPPSKADAGKASSKSILDGKPKEYTLQQNAKFYASADSPAADYQRAIEKIHQTRRRSKTKSAASQTLVTLCRIFGAHFSGRETALGAIKVIDIVLQDMVSDETIHLTAGGIASLAPGFWVVDDMVSALVCMYVPNRVHGELAIGIPSDVAVWTTSLENAAQMLSDGFSLPFALTEDTSEAVSVLNEVDMHWLFFVARRQTCEIIIYDSWFFPRYEAAQKQAHRERVERLLKDLFNKLCGSEVCSPSWADTKEDWECVWPDTALQANHDDCAIHGVQNLVEYVYRGMVRPSHLFFDAASYRAAYACRLEKVLVQGDTSGCSDLDYDETLTALHKTGDVVQSPGLDSESGNESDSTSEDAEMHDGPQTDVDEDDDDDNNNPQQQHTMFEEIITHKGEVLRSELRRIACDILPSDEGMLEAQIIDGVMGEIRNSVEIEDEDSLRHRISSVLLESDRTFTKQQPVKGRGMVYSLHPGPGRQVGTAAIRRLFSDPEAPPVLQDAIDCSPRLIISQVRNSGAFRTVDEIEDMETRALDQVRAYHKRFGASSRAPVKVGSPAELRNIPDQVSWIPYTYSGSSRSRFLDPSDKGQSGRTGNLIRQLLSELDDLAQQQNESIEIMLLQSGPDGGSTNNDTWQYLCSTYPKLTFRLTIVSSALRAWNANFFRTSGLEAWATFDVNELGRLYTNAFANDSIDLDQPEHRFLLATTICDYVRRDGGQVLSATVAILLTGIGRKTFTLDSSDQECEICDWKRTEGHESVDITPLDRSWSRGTSEPLALRCNVHSEAESEVFEKAHESRRTAKKSTSNATTNAIKGRGYQWTAAEDLVMWLACLAIQDNEYESRAAWQLARSVVHTRSRTAHKTRKFRSKIYPGKRSSDELRAIIDALAKKAGQVDFVATGPRQQTATEMLSMIRLRNIEAEQENDGRDHACSQCPSRFRRKRNLRAHEREIHSGEKRHKCRHCSRAFARRRDMGQHEGKCSAGK